MANCRLRVCLRIALIGCVIGSAAPSGASPILVGTPGPGGVVEENCIPFGCHTFLGLGGTYQQVYTSNVFGGPVTINAITLFDTFAATGSNPNAITNGIYTVTLSTTAAAVGGLSTTLPNNVGADSHVFFSGPLGGPLGGATFTVAGSPFPYDPALGNLLLQIGVTPTGVDTFVSLDADFNSVQFSRAFSRQPPTLSAITDSVGLVTQFEVATVPTAVPEPATLCLLGTGLATLAFVRRKSR